MERRPGAGGILQSDAEWGGVQHPGRPRAPCPSTSRTASAHGHAALP